MRTNSSFNIHNPGARSRFGPQVGSLLLVAASVAALSGCAGAAKNSAVAASSSDAIASASTAGSTGTAGPIPFGPGPQTKYAFQAQPAAGTCHYRTDAGYPAPDPTCTPGALNPLVTQDTLQQTICKTGYTATIRPSSSLTGREKTANALSYGFTGDMTTAEYDHLISLELGGDPNDPRNLWVEPNDHTAAKGTTNSKDAVENAAHKAICDGRITLTRAQSLIVNDWVGLGRELGIALPAK